MANRIIRVIICVFLQIIVSASCFAHDRKLYILNNSLFVENTEVVVLCENQEAYFYDLGDLYLILIVSNILQEEYSLLYNAQKEQIEYLEFNVSPYSNVYFWNSILIYRVKKKSGGSVLFDTNNQKQTFFKEWIDDFYTINGELCILTRTKFKCLTSEVEYKGDVTPMRLPALVREKVDVLVN